MKTALFFDGKNFYSGWRERTNRAPLDFVRLSQWLVVEAGGTRLWAAHYYTGVESGNEAAESQGQQSLSRFLDWLDEEPGFFVQRFPRRSRSIVCDHCGESVRYSEEKEVDTTLVSDLVRLAAVNAYDIAVLISGDGDFASALEAARALGKQTFVATWGKTGLSSHLRRAAYHHLDLLDGLPVFGQRLAVPPTSPTSLTPPVPRAAPPKPEPPLAAPSSSHLSPPAREVGQSEVAALKVKATEEEESADLPPELQAFLEELKRAETHFHDKGGYLGVNYFVTRWQSESLPSSVEKCRDYLDTLESLGRIAIYSTPGGDLAIRSKEF